jgi:hypothetical protein
MAMSWLDDSMFAQPEQQFFNREETQMAQPMQMPMAAPAAPKPQASGGGDDGGGGLLGNILGGAGKAIGGLFSAAAPAVTTLAGGAADAVVANPEVLLASRGGMIPSKKMKNYDVGGRVTDDTQDSFTDVPQQAPVDVNPTVVSGTPAYEKDAPVLQAKAKDLPDPTQPVTNISLDTVPTSVGGAVAQKTAAPGMNGVQQQISGIQNQADAESDQGNQELEATKANEQNLASLSDVYNHKLQGLEQERQHIVDDMANGHIDPEHYMNNMNTAGKVSTAIGLMLGGIGSAFLGQKNPAMEYLNKQIDMDVDAQKANMQGKQNLLHAVQQEFGNLQDSTQAMRVIYASKYSNDIAKAAAQSKDPIVQARAEQAIGAIKAQYAPIIQQLALKATVDHGLQTGQVSPEQAVQFKVPEARQKEVFTEINNAKQTARSAKAILNAYNDMVDENSALSRLGRAGTTSPATLKFRALTLPIIHDQEGRVNEFEQKTLTDLEPGITNFKEDTIKSNREALEQFMQHKMAASTALGYGIDLSKVPGYYIDIAAPNKKVAPNYRK